MYKYINFMLKTSQLKLNYFIFDIQKIPHKLKYIIQINREMIWYLLGC